MGITEGAKSVADTGADETATEGDVDSIAEEKLARAQQQSHLHKNDKEG